jgi:hypothetical protein
MEPARRGAPTPAAPTTSRRRPRWRVSMQRHRGKAPVLLPSCAAPTARGARRVTPGSARQVWPGAWGSAAPVPPHCWPRTAGSPPGQGAAGGSGMGVDLQPPMKPSPTGPPRPSQQRAQGHADRAARSCTHHAAHAGLATQGRCRCSSSTPGTPLGRAPRHHPVRWTKGPGPHCGNGRGGAGTHRLHQPHPPTLPVASTGPASSAVSREPAVVHVDAAPPRPRRARRRTPRARARTRARAPRAAAAAPRLRPPAPPTATPPPGLSHQRQLGPRPPPSPPRLDGGRRHRASPTQRRQMCCAGRACAAIAGRRLCSGRRLHSTAQ